MESQLLIKGIRFLERVQTSGTETDDIVQVKQLLAHLAGQMQHQQQQQEQQKQQMQHQQQQQEQQKQQMQQGG